jgi:putative transposase
MKSPQKNGPLNPKRHPVRYNTPGHAHELTFSCYNHRDYFSAPTACEMLLRELQRARDERHFRIWAYVVMPNHVHLLIWPVQGVYSISRIQNDIAGRMAKRYRDYLLSDDPERFEAFTLRERRRKVFRFWQRGGGYDRNLWNTEAIHRAIEYIEANPVRKNLVREPQEYRWSSAYARANGTGLVPDRFEMPMRMPDASRP